MTAKDWFEVALRVVGVLALIYGVGYLLDSLLFRLGYFNYPDSSPGYYVINGLFLLIVGLYLLYGAPLLVSFAYPTEAEDENDADDEEAEHEGE